MAWSISSDNVNVNVVDYLSGKNVQTFIIDAAVKVLSVLFDHRITFDLNGKLCCFCNMGKPSTISAHCCTHEWNTMHATYLRE